VHSRPPVWCTLTATRETAKYSTTLPQST
jgi:hypothetical protein